MQPPIGKATFLSQERLGEQIRSAREFARMSQAEVAQSLEVTPAALSQYEAGKRRIDALLLDRLGRLYGVPLRSFFAEDERYADWEEAVRLRANDLSARGKAGIASLIETIRDFEELHRRTGTQFPGCPRSPFDPLPEQPFTVDDVATWAERARRYYDLGVAPLPHLRWFLEAQGYQIFTVSLGGDNDDLAGLFFRHQELGPIVALNADQAYTRRPYTMAHEFAHGLYHYDRPAILCRSCDQRPLEQFADRFASFFLVPREALSVRLQENGWRTVDSPDQVVHLARYFGVSYQAMRRRLKEERRLAPALWDLSVKPVARAKALGYQPSRFEFGERILPPEERLPRRFIELANRAIQDGELSLRRVAEMLAVSDLELEERLEPLAAEEFTDEACA